jgi:hypothetical protein
MSGEANLFLRLHGDGSLRRTIRRYKLGYVVSGILLFSGFAALFVVAWEIWPELSSNSVSASTLWNLLWIKEMNIVPGLIFNLAYLLIFATATLVSGIIVFLFSRQWFNLPGRTFDLQCPFCNKYWKATFDRGQILCPHCRHLVHPKLVGR